MPFSEATQTNPIRATIRRLIESAGSSGETADHIEEA